MMVGRELKESIPKQAAARASVLLEVRGLTRAGAFADISFTVRKGEVVGLGGLVGAGRTEVARAIFGADRVDARRDPAGRPPRADPLAPRRDPAGHRAGAGGPQALGLVLGMAVRENVTLANLEAVAPGGFIRPAAGARGRRAVHPAC